MTVELDSLVQELGAAKAEALRDLKARRARGALETEIARAEGRYEGLKSALDLVGGLRKITELRGSEPDGS